MESTHSVTDVLNAGIAHHASGEYGRAVDCYSVVLATQPEHGEAWRLLGVVALQTGDTHSARRLIERALRIDAADAAAHMALGNVAEAEGNLDAAYTEYAVAYKLEPAQPTAAAGLVRLALASGNSRDAIAIGEAAVADGDRDVALFRALGAARLTVGDHAGAAVASIAALQIAPHVDAYANLAAACMHLHRVDAAVAACEAALSIDPAHADAWNNLGIARKAQHAFSPALGAFARAAELGSEDGHINLGTTRLLLGDYCAGWPEYGWTSPERRASAPSTLLPMWDGEPIPTQRLLIWPEQGIGDTIQMVRFLARARDCARSITLACPPGTLDLLRTAEGVDATIDINAPLKLDSADAWLPTIRLPLVFGVEQQTIPAHPYLRSDPRRVERFRPLIDGSGGFRVGLVWSGSAQFRWNDLRSCGLAQLEPLNAVSGVTWFALQQGAAKIERPENGMSLVPINAQVADFGDTAAIITLLDLVITVDTSVAHLAGALGRPAWVLLSNRPDWRWQLAGDKSPWYPTLRLFRQADDGAWGPVVTTVADALRKLVGDGPKDA